MKALEVPEILWLIGGFLDYPRLAAATTVCKSWNTIFTPFLYHTLEWGNHNQRHPRSSVVKDRVDHIRVIKLSDYWIPSLVDCTHLEGLHLNLDYGEQDFWTPLAKLVRQNPRLVTLCAIKPSSEFLEAVFACSPQLKRLEISRPNLVTSAMADPFLNACLSLEELKMVDLTLDIGGDDTSWIQWPAAFPTIKKLWIGVTYNRECKPRQLQQQHQFIQRCPNLESLTWSFSTCLRLPIHEIKDLLSPKTSPCPKIKAFAFHCPGFRLNLPEDTLVEVLKACNNNLASFESDGVRFMHLYSQALTSGLASGLTRLCLNNCGSRTSRPMMKILLSCPHLVHVHCAGLLHAQDILGIDHSKTPGWLLEDQLELIHPPEWVCKNLQILEIGICGLQFRAQEWQQAVLKQLAKLEHLRVLDVADHTDMLKIRSQDGLDFRLTTGLDVLSSLTRLERLGFHSLRQEMTKQDVKWMIKAWPRLSSVCGWVHHSVSERIKLEKIFKRHSIAVDHL
ncbi:MAG: hypothetical protein J3Q66DRAFT_348168, partial [Benniella sp.]